MAAERIYAPDLQPVIEREHRYIELRRKQAARDYGFNPDDDCSKEELFPEPRPIGLSFSGGGLRSATFNLGVVQALSRHGILPFVDYLSTVSGGGYLGSSLTSLLNLHCHDENATGFCEDDCEDPDHPHEDQPEFPFSTQYRNFPFNPEFNLFEREGSAGDVIGGNPQLDHMRRVGNFLIQRAGILSRDYVRTIGTVLSGIIYTTILFGIVLFLFAAGHYTVMGVLVPGISEQGIPTTSLPVGADEEPGLLTLYDDMVRASFQHYDDASGTFAAPPPVYRTALLAGMIGSIVWALLVLPYYTALARRPAGKTKEDLDIPVLWATGVIHFLILMAIFIWLR